MKKKRGHHCKYRRGISQFISVCSSDRHGVADDTARPACLLFDSVSYAGIYFRNKQSVRIVKQMEA
jgi:hypothetical protein